MLIEVELERRESLVAAEDCAKELRSVTVGGAWKAPTTAREAKRSAKIFILVVLHPIPKMGGLVSNMASIRLEAWSLGGCVPGKRFGVYY